MWGEDYFVTLCAREAVSSQCFKCMHSHASDLWQEFLNMKILPGASVEDGIKL